MDGLRNIARTFRAEYRKTPNTLKVPPYPLSTLEHIAAQRLAR